jgi:S-adenosylmethionine synthetase
LEVERTLNSQEVKAIIPASGQDIKVMGVRDGDAISLTISCAFIARYLDGPKAYAEAKSQVAARARERAQAIAGVTVAVTVNAGDDPDRGAIFLTETGTSAEAGDDGETGRGNRANGLITPFRPMTMEAVAGKNPLTHIGKLYNVAAQQLAEAVVGEVAGVLEAECFLVNQIGAPIDRPTITLVRARTEAGVIAPYSARQIEDITERQVAGIRDLWTGFVDGRYRVA